MFGTLRPTLDPTLSPTLSWLRLLHPLRRAHSKSVKREIGSAQPRPPMVEPTVDFLMEGEPVVSRAEVLQEPQRSKQKIEYTPFVW